MPRVTPKQSAIKILKQIKTPTALLRSLPYFDLEIERPVVRNVEAWYKRLQDMPAYREHVMVPFKEMYGKLSY